MPEDRALRSCGRSGVCRKGERELPEKAAGSGGNSSACWLRASLETPRDLGSLVAVSCCVSASAPSEMDFRVAVSVSSSRAYCPLKEIIWGCQICPKSGVE